MTGAATNSPRFGKESSVRTAEDVNLYEWAEFNLPAELLARPTVVSPLARRVLAPPTRPLAVGEPEPTLPGRLAALLVRRPPRPVPGL